MKKARKKVTLQHIAQQCGVSTATVSRVIHNNGFVSEDTKELILSTIKSTGYTLKSRSGNDANESVLSKRRKVTLLWTARQELQMSTAGRDMMQGISQALRQHNITMTLEYVDAATPNTENLHDLDVEGVIVHGPPPPSSYANSLKKLPVVWLLQQGDFSYGDRVQPDHHAIGRLSAQYLMDVGLTHMACIYGFSKCKHHFAESRAESFLACLKKNNVQVDVLSYDMDDQKLNPVDIQREAAADLVARFAALKPRPSALFVASEIGPYVHLELVNRGIVPMQDVCLIAGDLNICAQFALSPKPLAWRVHSQNIGYQAVEMLLARIKNPHLPQLTTYLRPRLHMPEQS
jgi:DNA-binding LacI/PurR family transcriptional regulator